jgi:hypothetical protein
VSAAIDKKQALLVLQKGQVILTGQFVQGSNYTFLVDIDHNGQKYPAVYKPSRGEQPLWDFLQGTLSRREVAAFAISEALGWELVPPTIYRRNAPIGAGSLQLYIDHDPNYHYFSFKPADRARLRPVALFDLLINNADRKGSHVLIDEQGHLWLIDHGISFHVEDKLRTVIWDFAGEDIPVQLARDVSELIEKLEKPDEAVSKSLSKLLSQAEIKAMQIRGRKLLAAGCFPQPAEDRRPYPWPLV